MSYQRLYDSFNERYSNEWSKSKIQSEVNKEWKEFGGRYKKDATGLDNAVTARVQQLKQEATRRKSQLLNFFTHVRKLSYRKGVSNAFLWLSCSGKGLVVFFRTISCHFIRNFGSYIRCTP